MAVLEHVSKDYVRGTTTVSALRDISFRAEAGTFYALMGPSGCGKTTLLNLLAGLDRPSGGVVYLAGRSTADLSDAEWTHLRRHTIGMVFQAFHLLPGLTARENVALPLLLSGWSGGDAAERVTACLDAVGMRSRERHRPGELSGGEQQRVAIARAIASRPAVLLADEPTGNLDSKIGSEILGLLRALATKDGHTVVMATHSDAAAKQADRVCLLQDGRLTFPEGAPRA